MTPISVPAPMLPTRIDTPFDAPDYSFEIKWDGLRCLCLIVNGRSRLFSRAQREITHLFPELEDVASAVALETVLLDGELCVFDDDRPNFEAVLRRNRLTDVGAIRHEARERPAAYVVFDVLQVEERSVMQLPWYKRRSKLENIWRGQGGTILSTTVREKGTAFFDAVMTKDLEGIVAKRHDSPYVPGQRSPLWLKIRKEQELDCVIGGYVSRSDGSLASVALGLYDENILVYIGNVGTGWSEDMRAHLFQKLLSLQTRGQTFQGSDNPLITPVTPRLVCRIAFFEVTTKGHLRHGTFRGLRNDKHPSECTLQQLHVDSREAYGVRHR